MPPEMEVIVEVLAGKLWNRMDVTVVGLGHNGRCMRLRRT